MNHRFAILPAVLGLGALIAAPQQAHAYVYSSSANFASWTDNTYTVYNDVWGNHRKGTQVLNVNSASSWNAYSNQSGSGVKSYPDVSFLTGNRALSSFTSCTASFNFTSPSDASYDTAFDLWSSNNADEVMIWEDWNGSVGPIASSYTCNGACPIYTNVSIGGSTWNVYQGNTGHNVVSFLRTTKRTSGTEDCLAIMNWAAANNLLLSNTLNQVQFGVEITATNGWEYFWCNSYSSTTN
jgi:accessory colonization factor AcfC